MRASLVELAARIVPTEPTLTRMTCATAACGAWTGGCLQRLLACHGGLRPGGHGRRRDGAHDRADGHWQVTVACDTSMGTLRTVRY